MYSKFGQFIDGKWQQAEKKETYDVINPATEEVIGKASKASSIDVQKAVYEPYPYFDLSNSAGRGGSSSYCTMTGR